VGFKPFFGRGLGLVAYQELNAKEDLLDEVGFECLEVFVGHGMARRRDRWAGF